MCVPACARCKSGTARRGGRRCWRRGAGPRSGVMASFHPRGDQENQMRLRLDGGGQVGCQVQFVSRARSTREHRLGPHGEDVGDLEATTSAQSSPWEGAEQARRLDVQTGGSAQGRESRPGSGCRLADRILQAGGTFALKPAKQRVGVKVTWRLQCSLARHQGRARSRRVGRITNGGGMNVKLVRCRQLVVVGHVTSRRRFQAQLLPLHTRCSAAMELQARVASSAQNRAAGAGRSLRAYCGYRPRG